jgi:TPR repeat protein
MDNFKEHRLRIFAAVFLFLLLALSVLVYDDVFKPLSPADLAEVRSRAEHGDASAQLDMGNLYSGQQGVTQDWAESFKWVRRSAGQGNVDAQKHLAQLYMEGLGIRKNQKEAYFWISVVAAQDQAYETLRDTYAQALDNKDREAIKKRVLIWKPVLEKHPATAVATPK